MQRKTILTKEISLNYNILVFELSKPPTFYKIYCVRLALIHNRVLAL